MKRNQHVWGFMANGGSNGKGDLSQCQVKSCRKWSYEDDKTFKMSYDEYVKLHESGEINASEVLGERKVESIQTKHSKQK
jgi:hypothetical protein